MTKIEGYFGVISSKNDRANVIKNEIAKFANIIDVESSSEMMKSIKLNAILIIGGDGEMLHALHRFYKLDIPFIGINAGSLGFLMNESFNLDLISNFANKESITLFPLTMKAYTSTGIEKTFIAFNEVSLYRATNQAAKIEIKVNEQLQIPELISDGIIVSTPAGSTAYNLSAGGRIVPLDSKVVCVTPVCAFRPRRWHGAILPDTSKISFSVLEANKRPVNAVADFNEIQDVIKVEIQKQNSISARLIFISHSALDEKMIKEQFTV